MLSLKGGEGNCIFFDELFQGFCYKVSYKNGFVIITKASCLAVFTKFLCNSYWLGKFGYCYKFALNDYEMCCLTQWKMLINATKFWWSHM